MTDAEIKNFSHLTQTVSSHLGENMIQEIAENQDLALQMERFIQARGLDKLPEIPQSTFSKSEILRSFMNYLQTLDKNVFITGPFWVLTYYSTSIQRSYTISKGKYIRGGVLYDVGTEVFSKPDFPEDLELVPKDRYIGDAESTQLKNITPYLLNFGTSYQELKSSIDEQSEALIIRNSDDLININKGGINIQSSELTTKQLLSTFLWAYQLKTNATNLFHPAIERLFPINDLAKNLNNKLKLMESDPALAEALRDSVLKEVEQFINQQQMTSNLELISRYAGLGTERVNKIYQVISGYLPKK